MTSMPKASEVLRPGNAGSLNASIENAFFRQLRMPNGTYKTTCRRRLSQFDDLILNHIVRVKECYVLDVGVSSGATTIDLTQALRAIFQELHVVAVDQYLWGNLYYVGPRFEVLLTSRNEVIQVCIGALRRSLPHSPSHFRNQVMHFSMQIAAFVARRFAGGPRTVGLVVPEVTECQAIKLIEQDIRLRRQEWDGKFNLIRAANVLNRSYFNDADLKAGLRNLVQYLDSDGLLAICRTDDETGMHNGSIFKKCSGEGFRITEIASVGQGSEVRDIALNLEMT